MFENWFGLTDTFKMSANQRKMACTIFLKCCNSGNNSRNCTIFGAQENLGCSFDFLCFDRGVVGVGMV